MKTSRVETNKNIFVIILVMGFLAYTFVNDLIIKLISISIIVGLLFIYVALSKKVSKKFLLIQGCLLLLFLLIQFFIQG